MQVWIACPQGWYPKGPQSANEKRLFIRATLTQRRAYVKGIQAGFRSLASILYWGAAPGLVPLVPLNLKELREKDHAPSDAPAPIALTRTGASRGPPRSLPVAPLIGDQRCYGEAMAGLRR